MLQTPPRAPKANAYARRWTRTARTECLDWVLICNRRHLERVLTNYIRHDNTARPRRGNDLDVPVPSAGNADPRTQTLGHIERVDVLGGLIHDYRHAKPHLRSPACTGYRDCGAITEAALLGTRRLEPRTASCRALFRVCHWIPNPLLPTVATPSLSLLGASGCLPAQMQPGANLLLSLIVSVGTGFSGGKRGTVGTRSRLTAPPSLRSSHASKDGPALSGSRTTGVRVG
ncbi:integrase core domain-containing protein [Micromonospora sp. WMMD558]|uniref:integrase core domain-containing protein n=1 Tax=Micromonospora sp. WMMD558 TaxID=3403462 RepID=UPI003BF56780